MAAYREHISVSGILGVAYAGLASMAMGFTIDQGAVAGVLAWVGGMLPDLDSQSGRPVRELFGLISVLIPISTIPHLAAAGISTERIFLFIAVSYLTVRYGGAALLGRLSVHRGMFHSIPAMVIAAEIVFLAYPDASELVRLLMAGAVAVGFFSHLLLDEMYSVQWNGLRVKLAKSAGSAIKLFGNRVGPNAFTWSLLCFLTYANLVDVGILEGPDESEPLIAPALPEPATPELDPLREPSLPVRPELAPPRIGEGHHEMFR